MRIVKIPAREKIFIFKEAAIKNGVMRYIAKDPAYLAISIALDRAKNGDDKAKKVEMIFGKLGYVPEYGIFDSGKKMEIYMPTQFLPEAVKAVEMLSQSVVIQNSGVNFS